MTTTRSSSRISRRTVAPRRPGSDPVAQGRVKFVTSAHLVSEKSPELSELEFGLIMASNAFGRWIMRCMAAAGLPDLTTLDVLVLHHVNHRDRPKKLADVCFILNVEDTHTVAYSLKKLLALGVLSAQKVGKEVLYSTTEAGRGAVERYRRIRETCLVDSLVASGTDNAEIGDVARVLRAVSGLYDQAARAASSL